MATFQEFKEKALIGLFSVVVGMMWYDIKEMKADIKSLIVENAENKQKLLNLERQVYKAATYKSTFPINDNPLVAPYKAYAILNHSKDDDDYEHTNDNI